MLDHYLGPEQQSSLYTVVLLGRLLHCPIFSRYNYIKLRFIVYEYNIM